MARRVRMLAAGAVFAMTTPLAVAGTTTQAQAIVGGAKAHGKPWIVNVHVLDSGAGYGTGIQISASWILTDRHLLARRWHGAEVSFEHDPSKFQSSHVKVDGRKVAPHGRVMLLHLARPRRLPHSDYAPLNLHYNGRSRGTARIMGFGSYIFGSVSYPTYLKVARVWLSGGSRSHQRTSWKSGAANGGDSGGPLIFHGRVIALIWRGDWSGNDTDLVLTRYAGWINKHR